MDIRAETTSGGVVITVKVVPNASRAALAGLLGDILKIKVTKPPEKGKANHAVEELLAGVLRIAPTRVQVVAGHGHALKRVYISGLDAGTIQRRLLAKMAAP